MSSLDCINLISKNDLWRAALYCRCAYSPATLSEETEEEEHVTENFQKLVIVHSSSFHCSIRVTTDLRFVSKKRVVVLEYFREYFHTLFSTFDVFWSLRLPFPWSLERVLKASFLTNTAHIDVLRTKVSSYSRRGKKFKSIISYCQHLRLTTPLIFLYGCLYCQIESILHYLDDNRLKVRQINLTVACVIMENSSQPLLLHNVVLLARGSTEKGVAQPKLQADLWTLASVIEAHK